MTVTVMTDETVLTTERLTLRYWRSSDLDHLAAMNADDEVMRYFPDRPNREQSAATMARMKASFERHGFGFWALERSEDCVFVGFAGLLRPAFHTHFTPCVEVGWRLRRSAWGQGYATEAGRASLALAFDRFGLDEVVSMAVVDNLASRRVMERLGMTRRPQDDFGHPILPFDHPLRPHVLYRLSRKTWTGAR